MTFWGGIRHQNRTEILFLAKVVAELECDCASKVFRMENHNGTDKVWCGTCGEVREIHFDSLDEREDFLARYIDKVSDDD